MDWKNSSWYLWGFLTETSSYFELHDSRSGDIASDFLSQTRCEFLMSDLFPGYGKAVRLANEARAPKGDLPIRALFCNAHCRRSSRGR